jgi:anti-sigma regulatory factor (Ser/Thr protein kinase)
VGKETARQHLPAQDQAENPWPLPSTEPPARNLVVDLHATLELVPAWRAPRLARAFAAETLESWAVSAEGVEAVQLVVSELITNAVLHAPESTSVTLELVLSDDAVRVMVSDGSSYEPRQPWSQAPWTAQAGRGVALVDTIADRWGTEPRSPRGKTVWCELKAEPARP